MALICSIDRLYRWTEAFTCHTASRETRDTARGRGMPSPYGRPLLFSMERISGWHGISCTLLNEVRLDGRRAVGDKVCRQPWERSRWSGGGRDFETSLP